MGERTDLDVLWFPELGEPQARPQVVRGSHRTARAETGGMLREFTVQHERRMITHRGEGRTGRDARLEMLSNAEEWYQNLQ